MKHLFNWQKILFFLMPLTLAVIHTQETSATIKHSLYLGESVTIDSPTPPLNGTLSDVRILSISKNGYLDISKRGDLSVVITPTAYYSSTITVELLWIGSYIGTYSQKTEKYEYTETVQITIKRPTVERENPNITINIGQTEQLKFKVTPDYGVPIPMNWGYVEVLAPSSIYFDMSDDGYNCYVTGRSAGTGYALALPWNNQSYAMVYTITVVDDRPRVTADLKAGTYAMGTQVTLTADKKGAAIYYTLDKTTPTNESQLYTGPITLYESVTLKACAYLDSIKGPVISRKYTITPGKLTLAASPQGGTVTAGTIVKLIPNVSDAQIYYTTNGTEPTQSSTLYTTSGIKVNSDVTIKARAYKDGYETSDILTATYKVSQTEKGIAIDKTNFPDDNFRNYLLSQTYGADGILASEEIAGIVDLFIENKNISSLQGIEKFQKLESLWCDDNNLSQIDVSKNMNLKYLSCVNNNLSQIDVSKNTDLEQLWCAINNLSQIDVSKNTVLERLNCRDNNLSQIDVSKNTVLESLNCSSNNLSQIDVSKNTVLESLNCSSNNLSQIDVSKNTNLEVLYCDNNQIKGVEMDRLVNALPLATGEFCVYSFSEKEGNMITKSQVAIAKGKGWRVVYEDGIWVYDYEGIEDSQTTQTITTSNSGYATFYDSSSAYILPTGLTASVVTNATNDKLNYRQIANGSSTNNIVPKNAAVLLTSSQKKATTYLLTSTDNNSSYTGTNLLHGSDIATTVNASGNNYFYKLSYGPSNSNLSNVFGWYWGAANGGTFQIGAHKAWLAIPKSTGANGYVFFTEEESTGIEIYDTAETTEPDVYYDLQGRQITAPKAKGIYIHKGKKVTIK